MEKSWKWAKNKVLKSENILKKSWNFSTAYHESRTRSSDNAISIGLMQWFGYGRLSVYVLNCYVRQVTNRLFDSLFSV